MCQVVLKVKLRGQKGNKRKRKRSSSPFFGLVSGEGEEKIEFRERESTFSLKSTAFGPSVLVGERGELGLHVKGYAWVPRSGVSNKLHDVRVFSYLG